MRVAGQMQEEFQQTRAEEVQYRAAQRKRDAILDDRIAHIVSAIGKLITALPAAK